MANTYIGNRGGIVYATATQTVTGSSTTNAVYTLPNHIFRFLGPVGLMVVTFPTPGETTVTGVDIQVNSHNLALTGTAGSALTTAPTTGDHLLFFNKIQNTLVLIS